MTVAAADARIRRLRPPKPHVDPFTAHGALVEEERRPDGTRETALTIFLAGAECPFTCSFCDLWQFTIDGPTPPGALAAQVEKVLNTTAVSKLDRLKLYNASNFFDRRAVPIADRERLAALAERFAAVTVESHVNTIGKDTLSFARQLRSRLEVAVGLETIHPQALARLNKRLELPRFAAAARLLADHDIDLRVFVLVGVPHVPAAESVSWTIRTVEYAAAQGASVVAIIPVRGGNGEMERLQSSGDFAPPSLSQLEAALDGCLQFTECVVTADTWDVEMFASCSACRAARADRLRRINLTGQPEARVDCAECGAA